ncbi:hypothetical protein GJAV_G00019970 [Gymnothorax javanicus]|nr:hypothetical protein GJAV_G00019970 [Gymnothorax javanicus]
MLLTPHLLGLALLISRAVGEGWEDRVGVFGDKVLEVPEGTDVPYPIFQFKSAHPEVTSYHITGQTNGKIAISNEGWLYLVKPLDWAEESTYNLELEALSDDSERVDGPCSVTINVRDINNHPPVFSEKEYHGEVMERSPAGQPFVSVSANDLDNPDTPNARLSYSIVSQIPDRLKKPLFQINGITGEISITADGEEHLKARDGALYGIQEDPNGKEDQLKRKFDEYCSPSEGIPYEQNPFYTCVERSEFMRMNPLDDPDYTLIVQAQDLEGASENALSANAKVTIVVKQNLWHSPGPIRIRENLDIEYPMKIAQVQSNNPAALYKLGEKERYPKFPFSINEGGEIFVIESLDREEQAMYTLVVFAQDGDGTDLDRPMEIPVIVEDVNDNRPMCEESEAVLEVQENELKGSQIGALHASDLDEENSVNSLLSYEVLKQEPIPSSGAIFSVDELNGNIQIVNSLPKRNEIPEYRLTVKVSDLGGNAGLSNECKIVIKVIDINNEIPVFEKNDYGKIETPEDSPPGTTLLTVHATDADDPGTGSSKVEYHITDGDQDGNFGIDEEGNIYVAKPLDHESKSTYRLKIDATNPEPLVSGVEYDSRSTVIVSVEVTDVDELPEFDTEFSEGSVPENATVGTTVIKMDAKDPEGGEVSYKLEGDENNWLEIDSATGEIKTKAKLDHEKAAVISVKVIAYEKASPEKSVEKEVTVRILDLNDNVPKLKENQAFVCRKKITPVFIHAEDMDSPPFGKPFTFVITQPKKFAHWQIETVDDTTAKLMLKRMPEDEKTFVLPINVKDNAGVGVTQKFEVRVCNCTELGYCYIPPGSHEWKYGLPTTIGILAGTFAFIGVILIIAVHRSKKGKKKKQPQQAEDTDAML